MLNSGNLLLLQLFISISKGLIEFHFHSILQYILIKFSIFKKNKFFTEYLSILLSYVNCIISCYPVLKCSFNKLSTISLLHLWPYSLLTLLFTLFALIVYHLLLFLYILIPALRLTIYMILKCHIFKF